MLKKEGIRKGAATKVTFEMDLPQAGQVEVVGAWNNWQPEVLKKFKNGKHKLSVTLPTGEHEFRYRVDGTEWINDPEADAYVPVAQGIENAVVKC